MEEATLTEAPIQPSRWERFTPQLQRAVYAAQERAASVGLREVRPEHLLEGLLAGADTVPPWIVTSLGVDLGPLRRGMETLSASERPNPDMRLAPRTLDALALAEWEARELRDTRVGTAHALLGLLDVESPAAECLWRWRMTRVYLFQWLVERTGEERMDAAPANWDYAPLQEAVGIPQTPTTTDADTVRTLLPIWLRFRAFWGLLQCLLILVTFAGGIAADSAISRYGYWLLLWSAEGAWTVFACCYLPRGLMQWERRAWTRLFAWLYVQCAVLTVAGITLPRVQLGALFNYAQGLLEVGAFSALGLAALLFGAREAFGVERREGWRAMYREAGWVLAAGALFGAAGLLSWHLASGHW